ncbi:hypothetical protein LDJ99_04115 [Fusobacterium nucleatum]|uniref:hypothetical protein n=1 Tax=Fusobacterium nucleatum TaxID=851 RepID=UPI0030CB4A03
MNKEILDLVEKIFTFLKVGNYNKLKNILATIEKDYPNYYKFFENFKDKNLSEKVSDVLSDVLDSLNLGGAPLTLLGKKAEKEEKEKELISKKGLLKDEISEILKNYSEPSEEKSFLEFLLEKI